MDVGQKALDRISDPRVFHDCDDPQNLHQAARAKARCTSASHVYRRIVPVIVAFVCVGESLWAQWSAERELASMSAKAAVPRTDHQEAIIPGKPGAARPTVSHRGSVLGRLEIPRLQLSYALLEGTDNRTLDKSIGHVEGTGLPGEIGNIGVCPATGTRIFESWSGYSEEMRSTSARRGVTSDMSSSGRACSPLETSKCWMSVMGLP